MAVWSEKQFIPFLLGIVLSLSIVGRSKASMPTGIYDLLPATYQRDTARRQLSRVMRTQVELLASERLVEYLRWSIPDPAALTCQQDAAQIRRKLTSDGLTIPSGSDEGLLSALIDFSSKLVVRLRLQEALETLSTTYRFLSCSNTIVSRGHLRDLFVLEAVIHLYQRDGLHVQAFTDALGIDPGMSLDARYPPRVQAAFKEVAALGTAGATVSLQASSPAGYYVDGEQLRQGRRVSPGRHLVQLEGPGKALRTVLVLVPAGTTTELSAMTDFGLASPEVVRQAFRDGLAAGHLDDYQNAGLKRFLAVLQEESLQITSLEAPGGLTLYRYSARNGLVPPIHLEEAAAPKNSPLALTVKYQLGGGASWTKETVSPGASIELSGFEQIFSGLEVGAFLAFRYDRAEQEMSPGVGLGLVSGWRIPIGERAWLLPAAGYGGGSAAPAVLPGCEAIAVDGQETIRCGADPAQGSINAAVRVRGHGPLVRLEAGLTPILHSPWHIGATLQCQFIAFASAKGGVAHYVGNDQPVTLEVSPDRSLSGLRVDALLGLQRMF